MFTHVNAIEVNKYNVLIIQNIWVCAADGTQGSAYAHALTLSYTALELFIY